MRPAILPAFRFASTLLIVSSGVLAIWALTLLSASNRELFGRNVDRRDAHPYRPGVPDSDMAEAADA